MKLHTPRLLWNLYRIRLECCVESPFHCPILHIFTRHFQDFFVCFWISKKNIFLVFSIGSVIFEKYFFKSPNFFRIFCFFSLQLVLYGMLHSFLKMSNSALSLNCSFYYWRSLPFISKLKILPEHFGKILAFIRYDNYNHTVIL